MSARRTALQSVRAWLQPTQAWLAVQLSGLGPGWRAPVVAEKAVGGDAFPVDDLRLATVGPWWRRRPMPQGLPPDQRAAAWDAHLARALRRTRPAVLHSHFGDQGWRDLGALRSLPEGRRPPHLVSYYGYDASLLPREEPAWRERYRDLFSGVAAVVCEGPAMAETIASLGCPRDRLRVHHLGVDLARLRFVPRAWRPGEPLRILMAGRFVEKKGFPDGLRAVARVAAEMPVAVTVVGDASDLPRSREEAERIAAAVRETGLAGRVRMAGLLGYQELVDEAYRHDVFLAPSKVSTDGDSEGGAPVTVLEMAATGLPVVATRHCDIPHVLPPESAPLLAAEGDIAGIAASLRWLVDHPDRWEPLARAARARLERDFDVAKQGPRLAGLYDEAARRHG